jgi:hypothetical protein
MKDLKNVTDGKEAAKRNFPQNKPFKLLQFDIVLVTEKQAEAARKEPTSG